GSTDFGQFDTLSGTTTTISGIPNDGSTVYVQLRSLINGSWSTNTYSFLTQNQGSKAAMTSPTSNSTLLGSRVTFTWNSSAAATGYWIDVNATCTGCGGTVYSQNAGLTTSATVPNIPLSGG